MIDLLFILFFSSPSWAAVPVATPLKMAPQAQLRFFYDLGNWSPVAQIAVGGTHLGRVQKSILLGTYYWLDPHWRVGLFAKIDQGNQQDTDWIKTTQDGWHWMDASHRTEGSVVVDVSPRLKLGALALFEIKSRLIWNQTQSLWTAALRPGVFLFNSESNPAYSVYVQTEAQIALDSRQSKIPETALYLGMMFHGTQEKIKMALGPYLSLWNQTWSSTTAFEQQRLTQYKITDQTFILGLAATLSLR